MPYVSTSLGITLETATNGTRNWGNNFLTNFVRPVSRHGHTGGGDGVQLGTLALQDNAVTGTKIRLANNQALRARNAANSDDVELLKLNASDQAEFGAAVVFSAAVTFSNINITGGSIVGITPLPVAYGGTGSANATAARSALGVGTLGEQNSNTVTITGGSITGITDLAVADGGTGASTAAGARSGLGAAASGANTDITGVATTGNLTFNANTSNGGFALSFQNNSILRWQINSLGAFMPGADNTYDIGGFNAVRSIYFKTQIKYDGAAKNLDYDAFGALTPRTSLNVGALVADAGSVQAVAELALTIGKYLVELGLLTNP